MNLRSREKYFEARKAILVDFGLVFERASDKNLVHNLFPNLPEYWVHMTASTPLLERLNYVMQPYILLSKAEARVCAASTVFQSYPYHLLTPETIHHIGTDKDFCLAVTNRFPESDLIINYKNVTEGLQLLQSFGRV